MFLTKNKMLTLLRESTPTTPQAGAGGPRSELLDNHGSKQTHQTTGEEEDLPDLSNMQVLLPQSDSHVPACWQLWHIIPTPYHWVGVGGGGGWPALHHIYPKPYIPYMLLYTLNAINPNQRQVDKPVGSLRSAQGCQRSA